MESILKKKIFILTLLSIISLLSIFILIDRYRLRRNVYNSLNIEFKNEDIEYGSDIKAKDIIISYDGDISIVNEIDTYTLGKQNINYTISKLEERYGQNVKKNVEHIVNIVDTNKPIIEFNNDEVRIYVNEEYDLKENIKRVYDLVDGDIENYEIIDNVDNKTKGEYEVEVKAIDKNNLENSNSFKVIVKNKVISASEGYDYIYSQLRNVYGYNDAATCGILANIRFESNFVADIGDYYYGLCQWGGSRKDNLFTYCANNGLDATSIDGQLAYLNHELSNGYSSVKNYLLNVENSSSGAYNAAVYFCDHFEGAASNEGRGDLAVSYFGG